MMLFKRISVLLCAALVMAVAGIATASVPAPTAPTPTKQAVTATMMGMPLQFEANHGQVDSQVKFLARGSGYTLFLTPTESVMVLQQREARAETTQIPVNGAPASIKPASFKQAVVRMSLEGANPSPAIEGVEPLPGIVNYFIGNEPDKWQTNIPTYAKVQYQEAYSGINVAYYGNQGKLEYDFIVAPGADPGQIKLAFDGTSDIRVAASGDLLLTTTLGEVRLQKPVVYQLEMDGHKTLVAGQYVMGADSASFHASRTTNHEVRIQLAAYDQTKPLVIDPVLLFSTHLGGNGPDGGRGIAVDANRNMYVTGLTASVDFPTLNPLQTSYGGGNLDAFVTKLNAAGALVYSTYLGGSGVEYGFEVAFPMNLNYGGPGIAVDMAGNAYVAGTTQSTNFPTLNANQPVNGNFFGGAADDAFVTKLSPTGGLVYSTYLGGDSSDYGFAIAVDSQQNAYVTGQTSGGFPVFNTPFFCLNQCINPPATDAFVTKFSPTGGLITSGVFGGGLSETGTGIAVDGLGTVYLVGITTTNLAFSTLNASQVTYGGNGDAFVAKLDLSTGVDWVTYLGGGAGDFGKGIALDASGNVYVTGETNSADFPTVNASQATGGGDFSVGGSDAFVAKYTSSGVRLYSTYLGGGNYDTGNGIAADAAGNAYVTGQTASADFPILNASQPTYGGTTVAGSNTDRGDAFVTKFNAAGARLYSTYLGGDGTEKGYGIAVDTLGNAHVTGETWSSNFPLVNPSQPSAGGLPDAFVAKLGEPNTNDPPVCTSAQPSIVSLWAPNQTMVPISITGITDPNNDPITITYPSVTQDEPISGLFATDLSPDAAVSGQQILLRAERGPRGDGRVYEVHFTATDSQGGSCNGTVKVRVPHSKKDTAVDSGQAYNSFGP